MSDDATIAWSDFEKVELCAGTVLRVEAFPEARKPAWKLWVDFGPRGVRKTSAQVQALYSADALIGRQIVGVLNFPPKQVGPMPSPFTAALAVRATGMRPIGSRSARSLLPCASRSSATETSCFPRTSSAAGPSPASRP